MTREPVERLRPMAFLWVTYWQVRVRPYQDWLSRTNDLAVIGVEPQLYVVPETLVGGDLDKALEATRQAQAAEAAAGPQDNAAGAERLLSDSVRSGTAQ